ncbi:MAG: radical SAM protein [Candidatus Omnitrophica bacterium]|nr:radical SAM protein [Candidatus Omnitrophota bacterium]
MHKPEMCQDDIFWIQLMVTNKCNLRCRLCNICREKPSVGVDLKKVSLVLKEVLSHTPYIGCFSFTGGEPFADMPRVRRLWRVLFPLLQAGKIQVLNFNTNGTLTRVMEKFIAEIPDTGVKRVSFNISLDGMLSSQDMLRGKGTFDKVLKSVRFLKKRGFPVTLNFVISPFNVADIFPLYQFAAKWGVEMEYNVYAENTKSFYHYSKPLRVSQNKEWRLLAAKEVERIIEDGARGCRVKQLEYIRDSFRLGRIPSELTRACLRPAKLIFIRATGEIFSCFYASPIANLKDFTWSSFLSERERLVTNIRSRACRGCLLGSLKYVQ